MKLSALLSANAVFAFPAAQEPNPIMNLMLMESLMGDSDSGNNDMLMMMLMSPGLMGQNPTQANQMSSMLPLLLMDSESDDNSNMLMMTMMMNPNADMNSMLPMLMMDDGATDMKSLFLMTTMMQANCEDTNQQMNTLLPLLLMGDDEDDTTDTTTDTTTDDSSSSNMKTMLLMQTMSQGNNGLDINAMLPFMLMDDSSDDDNMLLMVMLSSMFGGMDSADGFAHNFNMMLPMLMSEGDDGEEADTDMLVLLMAMQSQVITKVHLVQLRFKHFLTLALGSWYRHERPGYDALADDERLKQ